MSCRYEEPTESFSKTVRVSELKLVEVFKPMLESKELKTPIKYMVDEKIKKIFIKTSDEEWAIWEKIAGNPSQWDIKLNETETTMEYMNFFSSESDCWTNYKSIRDSVDDNREVKSNIEYPIVDDGNGGPSEVATISRAETAKYLETKS